MLYVTTRNNGDIFTVNHPLNKNRAEDGGAYVPFKLPRLDFGELKALPFNHRVANVLNLLFGTMIAMLSFVRTVVLRAPMLTTRPFTSSTSMRSPTLIGRSSKIINPLIKLFAMF